MRWILLTYFLALLVLRPATVEAISRKSLCMKLASLAALFDSSSGGARAARPSLPSYVADLDLQLSATLFGQYTLRIAEMPQGLEVWLITDSRRLKLNRLLVRRMTEAVSQKQSMSLDYVDEQLQLKEVVLTPEILEPQLLALQKNSSEPAHVLNRTFIETGHGPIQMRRLFVKNSINRAGLQRLHLIEERRAIYQAWDLIKADLKYRTSSQSPQKNSQTFDSALETLQDHVPEFYAALRKHF